MARSEYIIPQNLWSDQEISVNDWTIELSHLKSVRWNNIKTAPRKAVNLKQMVESPFISTNMALKLTEDGMPYENGEGQYTELGKYEAPCFIPVEWTEDNDGKRIDTNVKSMSCITFDFDGINDSRKEAILEAFDGLAFVAYSSFSNKSPNKFRSTPLDNNAFRVIVALDAPLEAMHYRDNKCGVWFLMKHLFPENDRSTKNSSRLWYYPSHRSDRADDYWSMACTGKALSTEALIDAMLDLNDRPSNPPSAPQATQQVQIVADTDSEEEDSQEQGERPQRYVTRVVRDDHRIRCHDGQDRTFGQIIDNWESFPKQANGNYNVCRPNSKTVGSAFIQRTVHPMYRVARYRLTSAPNRTHHDCDITDHRIALSFSQRGFRPKSTVPNVVKMLDLMDMDLWEDARTGYQYLDGDRFEDHHYTVIQEKFHDHWRIDVNRATMCTAIDSYCNGNKVDTLKTYLDDLVWDGTPRVDELFIKYMGAADTKINRVYGRKWCVSAVARALDWGCKVDCMPILKGAQGLRKSSFFRILAGRCALTGTSFFNSGAIETKGTDGLSKLRLAWIHEWAELSGMSRKENGEVKSFITENKDQYRAKYARKEKTHYRHCVIVGTVNDEEIFKDDTGSRRYWAIDCLGKEGTRAFEPDVLEAARDQIWAEAVHIYKQGIVYASPKPEQTKYLDDYFWLSEEEQKLSTQENSRFNSVDVHQVLVEEWLANQDGRIFNLAEMVEDIYMETYFTDDGEERKRNKAIKPKSYMNWYSQALKGLGCGMLNDGKKCRHNKKLSRWYVAPSVDEEDEFVTTCDPDNGNNTLQIRLENDPKAERYGMVVAAKRFAEDWVYYEDMSPEVQGDYDARYPKQSHLQVTKPMFTEDDVDDVLGFGSRRFRL